MSSVGPWGGLGKPGEAGVKWGGEETTLGAYAPARGASPKIIATVAACCKHTRDARACCNVAML
jgi:hypothetical protein